MHRTYEFLINQPGDAPVIHHNPHNLFLFLTHQHRRKSRNRGVERTAVTVPHRTTG